MTTPSKWHLSHFLLYIETTKDAGDVKKKKKRKKEVVLDRTCVWEWVFCN